MDKRDRSIVHVRQVLTRLRDKNGFTNLRLAKQARLSRSEVSRFMNGHSVPKLGFLQALCDVFGLKLGQVLLAEDMPTSNGYNYTATEHDFIMCLRQMDDEKREVVVRMVAFLKPRGVAPPR